MGEFYFLLGLVWICVAEFGNHNETMFAGYLIAGAICMIGGSIIRRMKK